jgi:cell division protein FtsW
LWATLDKPLMVVVSLLLALGALMVYSATFNYGFEEFGGNDTAILMRHLINMAIGLVCTVIFTLIDYRLMRRMAVIIMLMAVSFLIAVLMFGDRTFGARRALINGRFQPGEFSELAIIIYMAAWLGSKNTRIRSLAYGFIPFTFLVGIVGVLVMLQPDLSTAAVIFGTSAVMFYLAGADMRQILIALAIAFFTGLLMLQFFPYQLERVESFLDGLTDPLQTSWQVQQALSAFYAGGWTGRGLGEGLQKFRALPAPHTDSIFAVIGEELGVLGAVIVLAMYLAFVIRGFQIARRAPDAFGSLLAGGITIWVAGKALLNIAVMTALLPPTGVPLPFISFGGSSLVVLLVGVGLLLSVHRGTVIRRNTPERKIHVASYGRSRRDGRRRISSPGRSRSDVRALS